MRFVEGLRIAAGAMLRVSVAGLLLAAPVFLSDGDSTAPLHLGQEVRR